MPSSKTSPTLWRRIAIGQAVIVTCTLKISLSRYVLLDPILLTIYNSFSPQKLTFNCGVYSKQNFNQGQPHEYDQLKLTKLKALTWKVGRNEKNDNTKWMQSPNLQ